MRRTAEEKAEQIMSNVMIWESEDCGAGIDNREEVEAMIASAIREAEREVLEKTAEAFAERPNETWNGKVIAATLRHAAANL